MKFDLDLALGERGDRIMGAFGYAKALFDVSTVERHRGYLVSALRAMAADAGTRLGSIDLLGSAERELLLETWNRTEADYPSHLCVHELFEQQAARTPDAVAVVAGDASLSYGELNARANQLARRLQAQGLRPDERVAICVERSLEMVVGLLAILKAGGAYVPLDPAYPTERPGVHALRQRPETGAHPSPRPTGARQRSERPAASARPARPLHRRRPVERNRQGQPRPHDHGGSPPTTSPTSSTPQDLPARQRASWSNISNLVCRQSARFRSGHGKPASLCNSPDVERIKHRIRPKCVLSRRVLVRSAFVVVLDQCPC